MYGNVLEALREGRLEIGAQTLLEPGVWLTAPGSARIRIGSGTFLNLGVMVAAVELVEIGDHCMFANGCFVTDGNHRFDDPDQPVPWQGFTSKGPTRIGDNVWCGAGVVVTSGVTIGERCVIGANSVVTTDIPAFSIAAGAPGQGAAADRVPSRLTRSSAAGRPASQPDVGDDQPQAREMTGGVADLNAEGQPMHAMPAGLAPEPAALVQGARVQRHRHPGRRPGAGGWSAARG